MAVDLGIIKRVCSSRLCTPPAEKPCPFVYRTLGVTHDFECLFDLDPCEWDLEAIEEAAREIGAWKE